MTQEQKLIEDILEVAHQKNGVSIFKIQDALRAVLKDVDAMVEECQVKEKEPRKTIGYYLQVSGLWQKTTKEAYNMSSDNGLPKVRVNLEYWDESMELLNSNMRTDDAIKEVEEYLEELESKRDKTDFDKLLDIYKENLLSLSVLMIEKEIKEKKVHFISYPYRRKETPQKIKNEEILLQNEIYKIDEEAKALNRIINLQKQEIKEESEQDK